jgi:hypothetical protein
MVGVSFSTAPITATGRPRTRLITERGSSGSPLSAHTTLALTVG